MPLKRKKAVILLVSGRRDLDPTRSVTLRTSLVAAVTRRFRAIWRGVVESVGDNDCFGLVKTDDIRALQAIPPREYEFMRDAEKVTAFIAWLNEMINKEILEVTFMASAGRMGLWADTYILSAYQKGLMQARQDLRSIGAQLEPYTPISLRASLNAPFNAERLELIYTRTFNELKGVTDAMAAQISRVLAQGLAEGVGPYTVAKRLTERVENIGIVRARMLARTEIIYALNSAALSEYSAAERVIGETILIQWWTARDERVCVLGGKAKVRTLKGLQCIKDVQIGDYVLTHKDRFRKVTATMRRPYVGEIIRVELPVMKTGGNNISVSVTPEHPIYAQRDGVVQWIPAKELKLDDLVYVEGTKCKCGVVLPLPHTECSSCSSKRVNKKRWSDPAQRELLSLQNKKYGKTKLMRKGYEKAIKNNPNILEVAKQRISHTKKVRWATDKEYREKRIAINQRTALLPTHPFRAMSKERREEITHMACVARGRNHHGSSYLEKKMNWFLRTNNINFEPNWYFKAEGRRAYADFYLPGANVVVECDGFFHQFPEQQERDKVKERTLGEMGISVLRFTDDQIRNRFNDVASKIKEVCCIAQVKIKRITRKILTKRKNNNYIHHRVYNISVEEDESYVVNGIVVHNCAVCAPRHGKVYTQAEAQAIMLPHPNCRCALLPYILDEQGRVV